MACFLIQGSFECEKCGSISPPRYLPSTFCYQTSPLLCYLLPLLRQSTKEWPLPPTRLTFPIERALPQTLLSLFWEDDFTFPSCRFHFSIFKTHASLSFLSGRNYMLNLVGFSFYSVPYMFMAWECSATSFTFHRWEIHRLRKHSGFSMGE